MDREVFVTPEELEGVIRLLGKGNLEEVYEECDRLAQKYGFPALPEGDNYGLTTEGRIVTPDSITPVTNDQAFLAAIMSPAMKWVLGG